MTIPAGMPELSSDSFGPISEFIEHSPVRRLGPRAFEVLTLVASGHTNTSIAETMQISEATVVNHLTQIYARLNVPEDANARVMATLVMLRDSGTDPLSVA